MPTYNYLDKKNSENIVGKGENAADQHVLLFPPQCFLPHDRQNSSCERPFICVLQMLSIWCGQKSYCHLAKWLTRHPFTCNAHIVIYT